MSKGYLKTEGQVKWPKQWVKCLSIVGEMKSKNIMK